MTWKMMLPLEIEESGGTHLIGKKWQVSGNNNKFKVPKNIQMEVPERQEEVQICK